MAGNEGGSSETVEKWSRSEPRQAESDISDNYGNIFYPVKQAYKLLLQMNVDDVFYRSFDDYFTLPADTYWTFEEICENNGYVGESHWTTTEDGYINRLHRVYKGSPHITKCESFKAPSSSNFTDEQSED